MSNSYRPNGLQPVKNNNGDVIRTNRYYIPASLNAVSEGTVVTLGGTSSTVDTINGAFVGFGIPSVVVATGGDGNKILGPIVGFDVIPGNLTTASGFNAASTARIAIVADDPNQEFDIVDDGVGSGLAATDVGLNANLTIGTATQAQGDTTSLDTTTPATDATYQLKILGLAPEAGNTFAPYAKWRVKINNHCLGNIVVGV